jgi:type IV pilus assembly protein PilP
MTMAEHTLSAPKPLTAGHCRRAAGLTLLLGAGLLLMACSGQPHSDLVTYVEKVKSRPGGKIEPLPEIKPYETFVYDDSNLRDPFVPFTEVVQQAEVIDTGIRPDSNRKREALEEFPLDSLKYVGTLEKKGRVWALIEAPDKTVYRVQVGNHMGTNYGEIIEITETEIKLKEIIPNGATGGWVDRIATISLSE